MKIFNVFFIVCACVLALSAVNAHPWNPFKELERAGQRVRDAVISAGPAVEVVAQAANIAKGGN